MTKEKLRVAVTEAGVDGELTVFLKRTSLTEVVALRAANRLSDATAIPQLLRSGQDSRGHWIAIPFYPGQPASTETAIPENVAETLAAMHAYYLNSEAPERKTSAHGSKPGTKTPDPTYGPKPQTRSSTASQPFVNESKARDTRGGTPYQLLLQHDLKKRGTASTAQGWTSTFHTDSQKSETCCHCSDRTPPL